MPRTIHPDTLAALESGDNHEWAILVSLGFDSGVIHFSTLFRDIDSGGNTFLPVGGLGDLSPLRESTDSQPQNYRIIVSGIDITSLSLYLSSPYLGRPASFSYALVDDDQNIIGDPIGPQNTFMQSINIEEGEEPKITIECSNELADWDRPRASRYTQQEHNYWIAKQIKEGNLSAGTIDTAFRWVPTLEKREIIWPGRKFFE